MCSSSITKKECYDEKCSFVHIKGTSRKRANVGQMPDNQTSKSDNNNYSPQNDFLALFHNFKTDILQMIDQKINERIVLKPLTPQNNFQQQPQLTRSPYQHFHQPRLPPPPQPPTRPIIPHLPQNMEQTNQVPQISQWGPLGRIQPLQMF